MSVPLFRKVALAEATSFIALLVGSYLKREHDGEIFVTVLGPIHGVLFLAYVAIALSLRAELGWANGTTALVLLGAVVPFGGYFVDRWLARGTTGRAAAPGPGGADTPGGS